MNLPAYRQPLASVVVPVFNAMPFLDQALRSLREQSYGNVEILCLDDGSTDSSLAVMRRHANEDSRVRVISKVNEGYGATCNRGIDEARGEWLAILEPDDWLLPEGIERMVEFAYAAADVSGDEPSAEEAAPSRDIKADERETITSSLPDMVKTPYWRVLFADTEEQMLAHCYYRGTAAPAGALKMADGWIAQGAPAIASCTPLMEYHPSIWSALYRTDFLRDNGIRFLPIPGAGWADNPFLLETLCAARSIAYLDEPFYCYREETPAHFEATIRSQPLLVFDRWNDGADVLERYPAMDQRVVQAHYHRGFNNRGKAASVLGEESPIVAEQTARMFARMRPQLVLSDPALSPTQKALFASVRDIAYQPPAAEVLAFKVRTLHRQLRNIRTVGLKGARAIARLR